jgi:hypothetical protein
MSSIEIISPIITPDHIGMNIVPIMFKKINHVPENQEHVVSVFDHNNNQYNESYVSIVSHVNPKSIITVVRSFFPPNSEKMLDKELQKPKILISDRPSEIRKFINDNRIEGAKQSLKIFSQK